MNDDKQQVVGLAAALQSLTLVNQIATKGEFDREAAEPVLRALFIYSPDDALEAYGNTSSNLFVGTSALQRMLKVQQVNDVSSYLLNVLAVENKLVKNAPLLTTLRESCQEIGASLVKDAPVKDLLDEEDDFDDDFESVLSTEIDVSSHDVAERLAALYKQTASTVEPRIMINGDAKFLRDPEHANWIRALLLAAMRGAGFFRHNGGSRVNMLVKRATYLEELKRM